jgi:hypothetical protein
LCLLLFACGFFAGCENATAFPQGFIFEAKGADYGKLFPLVDCNIVHGGLGTTAEASAAQQPLSLLPCFLAFLLPRSLLSVCLHDVFITTQATLTLPPPPPLPLQAVRAGVPCMVTGVLLMDQRFWGNLCNASTAELYL